MSAASLAFAALAGPGIAFGQDGPVAWWKFDEADGGVAVDSSGNGHDGALVGDAIFEPDGGKFGGAVSLDGDGDLVEVPHTDQLGFAQGQDFSITLFYNSGGATSDNNNGLVTKGYGDDPRSPEGYYLLQVTNPSQFEFDSRCCAGATPRVRTGQVGPSITDGQWHNVTLVRDYAAGEMRSYIDANLEHTITMGAGTEGDWNMGVNTESLQIGDHLNRFTSGMFDDVALWRRALSEAEIAGIVANGVVSTLGEVAIAFSAEPAVILSGETSTLRWRVQPGATVTIDEGVGDVTAQTDAGGVGTIAVMPRSSTTYTLTADNGAATEDLEAKVTVRLIDSFAADVSTVGPGELVTLNWVVAPAASVTIDQGIGNVDAQTDNGVGSLQFAPAASATYTLTATDLDVEESASVQLSVIAGGEGPVAYWPFDEAEGSTAADATGNGNDGTLIGDALFEPAGGLFGGAVSLDGDGDLVEVPDADVLEFAQGQDFSITLFYNSGGATSDNNNGLVTKGYGDNPRSPEGYYLLQVTNPSRFEFDSRCCAGGTPRVRTGQIGPPITDGAWHNVTLVRDYGAGQIRSYIDGNLEHTITMGDGTEGDWNMGVNSEPLQIGDHLDRYTTGMFDDVALWRRVLADQEIASIAADGVAPQLGSGTIFQITEVAYSPATGEASFSWPSRPGQTFIIERGTDLQPSGVIGGWEELDDSFPAAEAPAEMTTFVDDALGDASRMFYRVSRN